MNVCSNADEIAAYRSKLMTLFGAPLHEMKQDDDVHSRTCLKLVTMQITNGCSQLILEPPDSRLAAILNRKIVKPQQLHFWKI